MALFRYTSNKNPNDETSQIVMDGALDEGGRRASMGEEIELSESEVALLRERHNLTEVKDEKDDSKDDNKSANVADRTP